MDDDLLDELFSLLESSIMEYMAEVESRNWTVEDLTEICRIVLTGYLIDTIKIIKRDGELPN